MRMRTTTRWIRCLLPIAMALPLAGCLTRSTPETGPDGAALYAQYCQVCHGPDGRMVEGVTNPVTISHPDFLRVVDDQFLFDSIAQGRPGSNGRGRPGTKMSAYGLEDGRVLSDEEIWAIVAHLGGWREGDRIEPEPFDASGGDVAAGAELYADRCAECHGPEGWGSQAPRLAGDTLQQTASDAYLAHTIRHGRAGTDMEAYDLDDAAMADLLAFIRQLDDRSEEP